MDGPGSAQRECLGLMQRVPSDDVHSRGEAQLALDVCLKRLIEKPA